MNRLLLRGSRGASRAVLAFFWLGLLATHAQDSAVYLLVGISGFGEPAIFQVTTPDDYRQLSERAVRDNEALPEAYRNVHKKWEDAHTKTVTKTVDLGGGKTQQVERKEKGPPLPLKRPAPREVRLLGTFRTQEAAEQQKQVNEGRDAARAERQAKKDEPKTVAAPAEYRLKRPERMIPGSRAPKVDNTTEQTELMKQLLQEVENVKARLAAEHARDATGLKTTPAGTDKPRSSRNDHRSGNPEFRFDSK
jgi:hypothetical protein